MSSPEEVRRQLKEQLNIMKRKIKADEKLKKEARQHLSEDINYNVKVDKIYKPFVDKLDKSLVPVTENVEKLKSEILPLKSGIQSMSNDILPLAVGLKDTHRIVQGFENQLQEYNDEIRELHRKTEDQLAIENIPEKVYNIIGAVAKKYLATRDTNDSLGLKWDDETNNYKLGVRPVYIDKNSDITIDYGDGKIYDPITGTEGLWRLLTQGKPYKTGEPSVKWKDVTTNKDIDRYRRLMHNTRACYKEKDGKWIRRSSTASKWNEIIKPFLDSMAQQKSTEGSGLTVIENDPDKLNHKLFVILGNIKAGHTNISDEDLQIASEILDILKPSLSSIAYSNIASIISDTINGRNS